MKDSFQKGQLVGKMFRVMLIGQYFAILANFVAGVVDGSVTGSFLGVKSLAAYGFAFTVTSVVTAVAGCLMTGTSIVCARNIHNENADIPKSIYTTALYFSLIIAAIMTGLILIFSDTLAGLTGASGIMQALASEYLRGYGIGVIPCVLLTVHLPVLQLNNDRKNLTISFTVMAVSDIILDIVNGMCLGLGLFGMGLATAVSFFFSMIPVLIHFAGKDRTFHLKVHSSRIVYIPQIIYFGYMYFLKQFFQTIVTFVFNNMIKDKYNQDMASVYTAIMSMGSIFSSVAMAIGNTTGIITGIYAGDHDGEGLIRLMKTMVCHSAVLCGALTVIGFVVSDGLVGIYLNDSPELKEICITGLRIFLFGLILRAINLSLRNYYQSMKFTKWAMTVITLQTLICPIIAMLAFENICGLTGIWISISAAEVMTILVIVLLCWFFSSKDSRKLSSGMLLHIPDDFFKG